MRSASSVNPHVREPDRGADRLAEAAPDAARQDARTGVPADIGVEEIGRGAAQRIVFGDSGERRDQPFERRAVSIGETAGITRRPGPDMHLAIAELDRHRDVFGAAFGAQFIELRKGARYGAVQPEPERPALAIDDRDRAAAKSAVSKTP